MRCPKCATNNGITCYAGKVCKRCGYELLPKIQIKDEEQNRKTMNEAKERRQFDKYYKNINLSAKEFRKRIGCDVCKKDTSTEAFLGWRGTVLWICGNCIEKLKNKDAILGDKV